MKPPPKRKARKVKYRYIEVCDQCGQETPCMAHTNIGGPQMYGTRRKRVPVTQLAPKGRGRSD